MSLNLTNPLGHAEQVSVAAEYGSQSSNVYSLAVTKPRPRGLPLLLDLRVNQLFHSHQWASSFSELTRGGALTATTCVLHGPGGWGVAGRGRGGSG